MLSWLCLPPLPLWFPWKGKGDVLVSFNVCVFVLCALSRAWLSVPRPLKGIKRTCKQRRKCAVADARSDVSPTVQWQPDRNSLIRYAVFIIHRPRMHTWTCTHARSGCEKYALDDAVLCFFVYATSSIFVAGWETCGSQSGLLALASNPGGGRTATSMQGRKTVPQPCNTGCRRKGDMPLAPKSSLVQKLHWLFRKSRVRPKTRKPMGLCPLLAV